MAMRKFLCETIPDEDAALAFLRKENVFESGNVQCKKCNSCMYEGFRGKSGVRKPIWKCSKHGCTAVRSFRASNAFFYYTTSNGMTVRQASFNTGCSKTTVVDWWNQCRETCGKFLESQEKLKGTEECPIQIDESRFAGRAKYGKGRRLKGDVPEDIEKWNNEDIRFGEDDPSWTWVLGIYLSHKQVRFIRIPKRDETTLMAVIDKHVETGSVIHTDGWAAYRALPQYGYTHKVVIHDRNYVDPETGAHTQGIEKAWDIAKRWMRASRGNTTLLQSHLDEVSWRAMYKGFPSEQLMYHFLHAVKKVHST